MTACGRHCGHTIWFFKPATLCGPPCSKTPWLRARLNLILPMRHEKPAHLTSSSKGSENGLGCALGMSRDCVPWATSDMPYMEWSHAQQCRREKDYAQRPKPETNTSWPMQVRPHGDVGVGFY